MTDLDLRLDDFVDLDAVLLNGECIFAAIFFFYSSSFFFLFLHKNRSSNKSSNNNKNIPAPIPAYNPVLLDYTVDKHVLFTHYEHTSNVTLLTIQPVYIHYLPRNY